jgi:hypothetical protein
MLTARQAAERTMRLAEQHVVQQEQRIEQQKNLISSLEVDGHVELARAARDLLKEMTILLARMHDDLEMAEARLTAWEMQ